MSRYVMSPRKRNLSAHQKQIRFFAGLALAICSLLTVLFFWLLNRPGFILH